MFKYLTICLFVGAAISGEIQQQNYAAGPLLKKLIRRRRFYTEDSCPLHLAAYGCVNPFIYSSSAPLYFPAAPNVPVPSFTPAPSYVPATPSSNLPDLPSTNTRPVFSESASTGPLTYTEEAQFPESGVSLSGSLSQETKFPTEGQSTGSLTYTEKAQLPESGVSLSGTLSQENKGIKHSEPANWESNQENRGISLDVVRPPDSGFDATVSDYVKPVDGLTIKVEHNQMYSPTGRRDGSHTSTGTVEVSGKGLTASVSGTHTPGQPNSNTVSLGFNNGGLETSVSRTNTVGLPSTNTRNLESYKDGFEAGFSVSRTEGMPSSKSANIQIPIDATVSEYVKPVDGLTIRGEHNQMYSSTGRRDEPQTGIGTVEIGGKGLTASVSDSYPHLENLLVPVQ